MTTGWKREPSHQRETSALVRGKLASQLARQRQGLPQLQPLELLPFLERSGDVDVWL